MANLYPPYIDAKLPAQVGNDLIIPYQDNRGVAVGAGISLVLKIKTINTNREISILEVSEIQDGKAIFKINGQFSLSIGQYYKAQLAYKQGEVTGYFSTVGIFKYTSRPNLTINTNDNITFIGTFTNDEDKTETVYSYSFSVLKNSKVIYDTGDLLHNASNDSEPGTSIDTFVNTIVYDSSSIYSIVYKIITQNGYETSQTISLELGGEENITLPGKLIATNNFNEGYISVSFTRTDNSPIRGQYRITRSSSLDNYSTREILSKIVINEGGEIELDGYFEVYRDFTVQQGVTYIYGLQQYYEHNNSTLSTSIQTSNYIVSDFEDAFLFDGEKQLKMKFNPKISSFKNTLLEQKLDTIGGKYPFIFRNNNVGYKEFQISALLSYHADLDNFFFTSKDTESFDTNLSMNNFFREREYREKVLAWLNNGKPKLFRSPAEGNYVVRLLNISLTPNDTLSRMLYTFNATAYEIADNSFNSLGRLGILNTNSEKIIGEYNSFFEINLSDIHELKNSNVYLNFGAGAKMIELYDFAEGTSVQLLFDIDEQGKEINNGYNPNIRIGKTGNYIAHINTSKTLKKIKLPKGCIGKIRFVGDYDAEFPILIDGKKMIQTNKATYVDQYFSETHWGADNDGQTIIEDMCRKNTGTLKNIYFMEIFVKSNSTDESHRNLKTNTTNFSENECFYEIDNKRYYLYSTEGDYIATSGRILYTAKDFGGNFVPQSIVLGSCVYANICYEIAYVVTEEYNAKGYIVEVI